MNREEMIQLAREADIDWHKHWDDDETNRLERFAALVAAAEREQCAKVCEVQARVWDHIDVTGRRNGDLVDSANICAAAIRARNEVGTA